MEQCLLEEIKDGSKNLHYGYKSYFLVNQLQNFVLATKAAIILDFFSQKKATSTTFANTA